MTIVMMDPMNTVVMWINRKMKPVLVPSLIAVRANVYHGPGFVMGMQIVRTVKMKELQAALKAIAQRLSGSALITIAVSRMIISVMGMMIVVTIQMKTTVLARIILQSAPQRLGNFSAKIGISASMILFCATGTLTVKTGQMRVVTVLRKLK